MGAFAAGVACRITDGLGEILLQDSGSLLDRYKYQGVLTKFPGGNRDPDLDGVFDEEGFIRTLRREFYEETGYKIKDGVRLKVLRDFIDKNQHKKFFLIPPSFLSGELRTEIITDGNSCLFPPYWVRIDQPGLELKIFRTHQPAFRSARRELYRNPHLYLVR